MLRKVKQLEMCKKVHKFNLLIKILANVCLVKSELRFMLLHSCKLNVNALISTKILPHATPMEVSNAVKVNVRVHAVRPRKILSLQ